MRKNAYRRTGATGRERSRKRKDPFFDTKAWQRLRWQVLQRDDFSCTACGTYIGQRGANVDHVQSRAVRPDLALEPDNLRTLCHACHSRKTARQDHAFGRAPKSGPAADCDQAGDPVDRNHPWNK